MEHVLVELLHRFTYPAMVLLLSAAGLGNTAKIRTTWRFVAPSVFKITTSRMRRKRVPATLAARITAPARIANPERKRITTAI